MACVFFCQKNKRQGRRIVLSLSPEWRVAVKALEACRKLEPDLAVADEVPENETRKHVIPWISL